MHASTQAQLLPRGVLGDAVHAVGLAVELLGQLVAQPCRTSSALSSDRWGRPTQAPGSRCQSGLSPSELRQGKLLHSSTSIAQFPMPGR